MDLLGVAAAGLLLVDDHDRLRVAASSSESADMLDLYQLQNDEGPCLECYQTGRPVATQLTDGERSRWPRFADAATARGFTSVMALPMRRRIEQAKGVLATHFDIGTGEAFELLRTGLAPPAAGCRSWPTRSGARGAMAPGGNTRARADSGRLPSCARETLMLLSRAPRNAAAR